jgi:hypothetical protein
MRYDEHRTPSDLTDTPPYPPDPNARRPRIGVYAAVLVMLIAALLLVWVLMALLG